MSTEPTIELNFLLAWATARSVSRGLPVPVIDGEAVRVDTGLPGEERRYIFAVPTPAIADLAATIERPGIPIKLCGPMADLMALLSPEWRPQPQAFFMICAGAMPAGPPLPPGYRLDIAYEGDVIVAEVLTDDVVVACGRAARHGDLLIYDQIRTDPGHGRRGLGSAIMRALATAGDGAAGRQALTATAAGRALYTALGWTVAAPWSTAEYAPAAG